MLAPFYQKNGIEAGCDEAGRGCLAGPVFAAAVILPKSFRHPLLNDSKLLNEQQREALKVVIEAEAIAWKVAKLTNKAIDKINILNASFKAMHKAVKGLPVQPDRLLIDGNRFHAYKGIPHVCIVKGDAKYLSIAAASILAKTYRDAYMLRIGKKFPQYGWEQNKGYPTAYHKNAIQCHGVTNYHRMTFRLTPTEKQSLRSKRLTKLS